MKDLENYKSSSRRGHMAQVYKVNEVTVTLEKSKPPVLVVVAKGETRTSGYTNGRLERRQYVIPPADGLQDYDFVADPPRGVATGALSPIEATDRWEDPPSWLKGSRVHAESNQMEGLI
jgi:hypothetical protein